MAATAAAAQAWCWIFPPTPRWERLLITTWCCANSFVSGYHARLRWDGTSWWLEDLGSRNGTFVNGKPCAPYRPEAVSTGDNIQLGDMSLQLYE